MSPQSLEPVFVKGHLSSMFQGLSLEYVHRNISLFGVTGLPWEPLSSEEHFGKRLSLKVRTSTPVPYEFLTEAVIMRESTLYSEQMGFRFLLSPAVQTELLALIQKVGFHPTEHVRKYPRIPAFTQVGNFPMRVIVSPLLSESVRDGQPLVFDLANLSPNGVLLFTENPLALSIIPNQRLDLVIEPRGQFPVPISLQGLVCRITDSIDTASGNRVRYLGIKFYKIDDMNRAAFLDLLRTILEQLKRVQPQSR